MGINYKIQQANGKQADVGKISFSLFDASYWHITVVQSPRSINCKGDKRDTVSELLTTNYVLP